MRLDQTRFADPVWWDDREVDEILNTRTNLFGYPAPAASTQILQTQEAVCEYSTSMLEQIFGNGHYFRPSEALDCTTEDPREDPGKNYSPVKGSTEGLAEDFADYRASHELTSHELTSHEPPRRGPSDPFNADESGIFSEPHTASDEQSVRRSRDQDSHQDRDGERAGDGLAERGGDPPTWTDSFLQPSLLGNPDPSSPREPMTRCPQVVGSSPAGPPSARVSVASVVYLAGPPSIGFFNPRHDHPAILSSGSSSGPPRPLPGSPYDTHGSATTPSGKSRMEFKPGTTHSESHTHPMTRALCSTH
ncbi:hypothetical protein GNI_106990 [Gregarina niphandrodes]|uniref:Uncharacterized protein n=1 Tax=Gregarina niphandrodes TaxID=110365 RepID=A0A023B3U0_GRENI|nr:hypothetical protein GNI_106990 [Gregarina niphandrodes]EZG55943.1 hypothetical protein GNI_106990 [Gregarina niphandrodes]|eukprot:XP_011131400.1 hypothetical protein GNI_106990 [Gregarina niphandrodes]